MQLVVANRKITQKWRREVSEFRKTQKRALKLVLEYVMLWELDSAQVSRLKNGMNDFE